MIRLDTLSTELLLFIFENLQDSLPSLCSLRLTCHLFSVLGCGSLQPYFRRKTIVFCSRSVDKLREISQHSSFRESILEVRLLYLQFDVQVLEDALAKAPDQLPRVRRFCDEQLAFEQSATDALNEVFDSLPNCKALDIRRYGPSLLECASPDAYRERHLGSATLPGEIERLLRAEYQNAHIPLMTTLHAVRLLRQRWESIHIEGPIEAMRDAFSPRYHHIYSQLCSAASTFVMRNDHIPQPDRPDRLPFTPTDTEYEDNEDDSEDEFVRHHVSPIQHGQDSFSMVPGLTARDGPIIVPALLSDLSLGRGLQEIHFQGGPQHKGFFDPQLLEHLRTTELLTFKHNTYTGHYLKPLLTYASRHPSLKAIHFTAVSFTQWCTPKSSYPRICPYFLQESEVERQVPPTYTLRPVRHIILEPSDPLVWDFYCNLATLGAPITHLNIRIREWFR